LTAEQNLELREVKRSQFGIINGYHVFRVAILGGKSPVVAPGDQEMAVHHHEFMVHDPI